MKYSTTDYKTGQTIKFRTKKEYINFQEETLDQYEILRKRMSQMNKEFGALKESIKTYPAGTYGSKALEFSERNVKAYRVPARIDRMIKIVDLDQKRLDEIYGD